MSKLVETLLETSPRPRPARTKRVFSVGVGLWPEGGAITSHGLVNVASLEIKHNGTTEERLALTKKIEAAVRAVCAEVGAECS